MNNKIIIFMLIIVGLMFAVSATTVVNLDPQRLLANNSYKNSATIIPNINVTGNSSTWICYLYGSQNSSNGVGTYRQLEINSGVINTTNTNFSTWTLADARSYKWSVKCNSTRDTKGSWGDGDADADWSANSTRNFTVDTTIPAINIKYPLTFLRGVSTKEWINLELQTSSNNYTGVTFGGNVTDNNPDKCTFYINYNLSTNTTLTNTSWEVLAVSNVTEFNFTSVGNSVRFIDNSTGYSWTVNCNDSATNFNSASGLFKVDTVKPTAFIFNVSMDIFRTNNRPLPLNATATDYTPQLGWNATEETNFNRYEIEFSPSVYNNGTAMVSKNVTTITTVYTTMASLVGDLLYYINITAFDDADNSLQMTTLGYTYTTDSTNHALKSGWNIIGNTGNAFNMSDLLTWSGGTTVSIWNSSHQFQSHVSGGSYGATSVPAGSPAFIYLSADADFSDMIWNVSAFSSLKVNVTNSSNSNWNLVMNKNSTRTQGFHFQRFDDYFNSNSSAAKMTAVDLNITYLDFFNNSASTGTKYVPFVGNWSTTYNETRIEFGQCLWLHTGTQINTAGFVGFNSLNTTGYFELNWGTVCRVFGSDTLCND